MRRRRAVLLGAASLALAAACHSWQPVDVPRAPAPVSRLRYPLRVEMRGGTVRELVNVVIATDSLFGNTNDEARLRVSVPLAQVASLEELRDDPGRTIGLIVLLAVLVATSGTAGF